MCLSTPLTAKTNHRADFTGITFVMHNHKFFVNLEQRGVGTWNTLGCWGYKIIKTKIRTWWLLFNLLELFTEHLFVFGRDISKFCWRMCSFALLKGQLSFQNLSACHKQERSLLENVSLSRSPQRQRGRDTFSYDRYMSALITSIFAEETPLRMLCLHQWNALRLRCIILTALLKWNTQNLRWWWLPIHINK